jgi:hypothetical protein
MSREQTGKEGRREGGKKKDCCSLRRMFEDNLTGFLREYCEIKLHLYSDAGLPVNAVRSCQPEGPRAEQSQYVRVVRADASTESWVDVDF